MGVIDALILHQRRCVRRSLLETALQLCCFRCNQCWRCGQESKGDGRGLNERVQTRHSECKGVDIAYLMGVVIGMVFQTWCRPLTRRGVTEILRQPL